MKKTKKTNPEIKEEVVSPTEVVVPQNIDFSKLSQPVKIALGVLVGLVVIGIALYNRFWNIASVNSKSISRLEYYQTLDRQYGKSVLDNMITQTLIINEATKNNVSIPQADIDAELATIDKQMQAQGTTLDAALAAENMTKDALVEQIKVRKLIQTMGKGEVNISETQIDDYLKTNKSNLPENAKPEELRSLAKTDLESQTANDNMEAWLKKLRSSALINYY